tara:strand:- start:3160 stop:3390 length:231 start_codon:yes stop_codon:yes gene_type:complete
MDTNDITGLTIIHTMSIFDHLGSRFSMKKIDKSKCYSRSKMDPLPTEIYQEIVNFQADVNRPIDISLYREFRKDAA